MSVDLWARASVRALRRPLTAEEETGVQTMASRKDFRLLAFELWRAKPDEADLSPINREERLAERMHVWRQAVSAVATAAHSMNPHFDRERFTKACETGRDGKQTLAHYL